MAADIVTGLSALLGRLSQLKQYSDRAREAEFANLLSTMSIDLADMRSRVAGLLEENTRLKQRVQELAQGERCPKCHEGAWRIESSKPDPTFGVVGLVQRIYKCPLCGFSETKTVEP